MHRNGHLLHLNQEKCENEAAFQHSLFYHIYQESIQKLNGMIFQCRKKTQNLNNNKMRKKELTCQER